MNKKLGNLLIYFGILMVICAFILVLFNELEAKSADEDAKAALEVISQVIPQEDESGFETEILPDYIINPEMDMPTTEYEGQDYIGLLEIPVLSLRLPVASEWSYPGLKISPCRYTGSAYLDNLIIAAHNYQSHFGRIKELQSGDDVIFTDMPGNVFNYKVAEQLTLIPTATVEIQEGDWDLTLFTCTVGGQYRVVVRCVAADRYN